VLAERRERVGSVIIQKVMEISRLTGTESIVGQHGKLEFYHALLNRKPRKICNSVCLLGEGDDSGKCVFCVALKRRVGVV